MVLIAHGLTYVQSLVLVHGICETKWTTEERQPLQAKESSGWLNSNVFGSCRFLHFYYDIEGDDDSEPALFYRGGVEKEALKLLDGLVELRNQFDEKVGPVCCHVCQGIICPRY